MKHQFQWEQFLCTPIIGPFASVGEYPYTTEPTAVVKKCTLNVFVQGAVHLQDDNTAKEDKCVRKK